MASNACLHGKSNTTNPMIHHQHRSQAMYFDCAVLTISEIGGHGNDALSDDDEYARDDRSKRIESAAAALCDWVFEYLDQHGEYGSAGRFKQEHLPIIQE